MGTRFILPRRDDHPLHYSEAAAIFEFQVTQAWAKNLKSLLEEKHLYQKVPLALEAEAGKLTAQIYQEDQQQAFKVHYANTLGKLLEIHLHKVESATKDFVPVTISNVTLYCSRCERREAYAPLAAMDIGREAKSSPQTKDDLFPAFGKVQIFILIFRCQHCLGIPETFVIRRQGTWLRLEGRSPIEKVEVPTYIPHKEEHFYSDAVVAYNSGKTLAALFYLRTFIEQFARRVTGLDGRVTGEDLLAAYANGIPKDLNDRMPSLRECYDDLSEAVHSAKDDAELLVKTRERVDKHFDIRRVFGVSEEPPTKTSDVTSQEHTPQVTEPTKA